jgi:S1-C subfamily serine protease
VWGLDARGRTPIDATVVGASFDEDHPLSRRIVAVQPNTAAARAGVVAGDIVARVQGRDVDQVANGVTRTLIGLALTESRRADIAVLRGGVPLTMTLALE